MNGAPTGEIALRRGGAPEGEPDNSGPTVNGEFFALAFASALNPKLLAIDLLLIDNRRPRAMFLSILAGGLGMAIAVGLVDVLVVRADTVNKQKSVSAGVDLAVGLILVIIAVLVATGPSLLRRRRHRAGSAEAPVKGKDKGTSWAQRALSEPRPLLAFAIGALIGLPGAEYLAALHNLIAGHYSTATRVLGVIVFSLIAFLLIIVPWLSLELWPTGTAAFLRRAQAWIAGHARLLIGWVAALLGAYLVISALVRLL